VRQKEQANIAKITLMLVKCIQWEVYNSQRIIFVCE